MGSRRPGRILIFLLFFKKETNTCVKIWIEKRQTVLKEGDNGRSKEHAQKHPHIPRAFNTQKR